MKGKITFALLLSTIIPPEIGRAKNTSTYNSVGDLMSEQSFVYLDEYDFNFFGSGQPQMGISSETYYYLKDVVNWTSSGHGYSENAYYFVGTTRKTAPSILKAVHSTANGYTQSTYNSEFDINTGIVLKTTSILHRQHPSTITTPASITSSLVTAEREILPAYTIDEYSGTNGNDVLLSGMNSKVYNLHNKNMLVQSAASLAKKDGKVMGVEIETWKGAWDNYYNWNNSEGYNESTSSDPYPIWRKYKVFAWNGELDEDGTYSDDFDTYADISYLRNNWNTLFGGDGVDKWEKTSEIVRYDHFSTPVEVKDINGDYAATKKDPTGTYTVATAANAMHSQFTHCGFEFAPYTNNQGEAGVYLNNPARVVIDEEGLFAHTGLGSLEAAASEVVIEYRVPIAQTDSWQYPVDFYTSVWIYDPQGQFGGTLSATINGPGISLETKTFSAGSWVQLSALYRLNSAPGTDITFSVINTGTSTTYFDDFRVAPYNAAVTSYTYDNAGNVTAIINTDNFATKYKYDEASRLTATYVEKPTGFELVSSHEYRYANEERPLNVTVLESLHGTVTCPDIIMPGEDCHISIDYDPDYYMISDVLINDESVGRLDSYTIENVREDLYIVVKYSVVHEIRVRIFDGENPPTGMLTDAGLELTIVEEGLSLPLVDGEFRDNFAEGWAGTLQPSLAGYYFEPATYVIDSLQQREIISFTGYEIGTITGSASANAFSIGTYTIPANATDITWSVPNGASIVSGNGTSSVNVRFGLTNGRVEAQFRIPETGAQIHTQGIDVNVTNTPAQYTMYGNATPYTCNVYTYSIDNISGAQYSWSVPASANIISGQNTTNLQLEYSNVSPGTVQVAVEVSDGFSSFTVSKDVTPVPTTLSDIDYAGFYACLNAIEPYSVTSNNPYLGYTWSVNNGAVINSGQNSAGIDVRYPATDNGNVTISVTTCNNTISKSQVIEVRGTPSTPTKNAWPAGPLCSSTQYNFSINPANDASYYSWLKNGVQQSTSTSWNISFVNGGDQNIEVLAINNCGTSSPLQETITVNDVTFSISKPATACKNQTTGEFSVPDIAGASYGWRVSNGTVVSGQGQNAMTARFTSGGMKTVEVDVTFACGQTKTYTTTINVGDLLPAPGSVSGPVKVATNTTDTYSISPVSGAEYYHWEVLNGGYVSSGQGTTSVEVTWTAPGNSFVSVVARNACGDSDMSKRDVFISSGGSEDPEQ
jgi:YD repeat-containing protein